MIRVTDVLDRTTTIQYDVLQRVKKVISPIGQFIEYAYDPVKNLLRGVRDDSGKETHYEYDELYRIKSVETPDHQISRVEYDAKGRIKTSYAPSGAAYNYDYDVMDRMTSVTDPAGHTWTYSYDALGNKTCQRDANGDISHFTYDEANFGLVKSRTLPLGQTEYFDYTADGNIKSVTDANGFTTSYQYDGMSGYLKSIVPDSRRQEAALVFDYSADGLLKRASRGSIINSYTYDGLGRMIGNDGKSYGYDAVGNLRFVETGTGRTSFEYDAADRLKKTIGSDNATTLYDYDQQSRLHTVTRPNGVVTTYEYDVMNRVTNMRHTSSNFTIPYQQTYDADGRVLTVADETGVTTYHYDITGRLDQEAGPRGVTTYTYDNVGNRLTKTISSSGISGTYIYGYDANDRMRSVTGPNGTTTYDYDGNGNCIRAGSVNLAYDYLDRNISAQMPTGLVTYTYDASGNRIAQTTPQGTTHYVVDGGNVIEERDVAGNVTRYEYDGGILRLQRGGQSAWFLDDLSGSTIGLTDGSGNLSDRYVYDAFGMPIRISGNTGNSFLGIGGQQYDEATGLYYLRARYYDPQAGRFLSADPLSGDDSYPATTNSYAYAGSDPVNNSDPSGLSFSLPEELMATSTAGMLRIAFFSGMVGAEYINQGGNLFEGPLDGNSNSNSRFFREVVDGTVKTVKEVALGGWIHALASPRADINPLAGMLFGAANTYQTSKSIQDAYDVLLDPSASPEEKELASYTAIFALAEFGFNSVGIVATDAQEALMSHNEEKASADEGEEDEVVSPSEPQRRTVAESRESRLSAGDESETDTIRYRQLRVLNEGNCFPEEVQTTVIRTVNGLQPQEEASTSKAMMSVRDVREGDWAASRNEVTGKTEWKQVKAKFVRHTDELVKLSFAVAGDVSRKIVETLRATPEHPFMTSRGWVVAGSLGIGTQILTRAGPPLVVVGIERQTNNKSNKVDSFTVYNFTVDSDHSYFVGTALGGAWVHNDCIEYTRFSRDRGAWRDKATGRFVKAPKYDLQARRWRGANGQFCVDWRR